MSDVLAIVFKLITVTSSCFINYYLLKINYWSYKVTFLINKSQYITLSNVLYVLMCFV